VKLRLSKVFMVVAMAIMVLALVACSQPAAPASTSAPSAATKTTAAPAATSSSAAATTTSPAATTKPAATAPSSANVIELKIANFQANTAMTNEMLTIWGKEIEKESNGRIKFTIYAGGVLVPANDTYEGVVNGIADIGLSMAGYTVGRFSLSEVVALPGLNLTGFGTMHSSKVLMDLWDKFPEIRAQYDDTHVLWVNGELYRELISTKPLKTLDELKGKKLRVPGSESSYVTAVGAIPVNLTGGEVYEALQRGVIDGNFHPWEAIVSYKLYEVAKYATMSSINNGGVFMMAMSKKKWESLPADIQKIITDHSGRYGALDIQATMREAAEQKFYDQIVNVQKIPVYQYSDSDKLKLTELEKPAVEKWITDQEKKGLPGRAVYDECIKLIAKYR
jgi:TRAP-type C4-dicarboxylate transport system substrate-binding protein